VVDDVGHRARSDADGDREDADQRSEQGEALGGEPDRARPGRQAPGQRESDQQHGADDALGDGGGAVLVAAREHAEVDQPGQNEARGLEEQEQPNQMPHADLPTLSIDVESFDVK
jgi:hypothetical protein